jgi:hypothetical protein
MDGFKKPYRSIHVYKHDKAHEDKTLVNLYKKSEFTKENSVKKDPKEPDDTLDIEAEEVEKKDDDIEAFINDAEVESEEEVPVKKSVKKARKKAAKKKKATKKVFKKIAILFVICLLSAGAVIGGLWFFRLKTNDKVLGPGRGEDAVADEIYYAPLTGLESTNKNIAKAGVTCVMIENSVDARPQSGLRAAGVVYEAHAEGGITRFMAVYQDNKPNYFGPIRSARLTFVQLAKQYQCGYVHMGGAANAINELRGAGYRDINAGYYEEKYVSRKISRGRWAPHNVYSRFSWMDQLNSAKGWTESVFTPFARIPADTITEVEKRDATKINIKFSPDNSYNTHYDYDATRNVYLRSHVRGGAHYDKEENGEKIQISPNVVIAMKVHVIPRAIDVNGYTDHVTYGEGDAFVFQDGTVTAAVWRRNTPDDPLKFYNKTSNEEIKLNRGQTWIAAYPDTIGAVSWE